VTGDTDRHALKELLEAKLSEEQTVKKIFLAKNKDGDFKYQGYAQAIIPSILLNDFSLHSGNIGVVNGKELVRVDFGAAFRGLDPEIHPFKSIAGNLGFEKNYFLRDHPKERYQNAEFVQEAHRMANVDLVKVIQESWKKIEKSYSPEDRQAFCKQIGMVDKSPSSARVQDYLITRMGERQESLKRFAEEITKEMEKEKWDNIEIATKVLINKPTGSPPKDVELTEITNKAPRTVGSIKTPKKPLEKSWDLRDMEYLTLEDITTMADERRNKKKNDSNSLDKDFHMENLTEEDIKGINEIRKALRYNKIVANSGNDFHGPAVKKSSQILTH
jgi:hypothetical protein